MATMSHYALLQQAQYAARRAAYNQQAQMDASGYLPSWYAGICPTPTCDRKTFRQELQEETNAWLEMS